MHPVSHPSPVLPSPLPLLCALCVFARVHASSACDQITLTGSMGQPDRVLTSARASVPLCLRERFFLTTCQLRGRLNAAELRRKIFSRRHGGHGGTCSCFMRSVMPANIYESSVPAARRGVRLIALPRVVRCSRNGHKEHKGTQRAHSDACASVPSSLL